MKIPHICDGVDVIRVGTGAFRRNSRLEEIQMPNSIAHIGRKVFYHYPKLTIICKPNSIAHQYAMDNNILFELKNEL